MKRRELLGLLVAVVSFAFLKAGLAETRYVSLSGGHVPPFTNWIDAATNIQAAIDVAVDSDTVLVSNGIYATGGRVVYGALTNRIAITKPVTVRSVHGSARTIIQGAGPVGDSAVRCAYVGTNAVLSGFTLTNGATRLAGDSNEEQSGGGAWCEALAVLSNCTLSHNAAFTKGGGAYNGTLNHCVLWGNSANEDGGGAVYSTLNHCVLTGNSANKYGGGAVLSTLNHCKLNGNSARFAGGGTFYGEIYNCILTGNFASFGGGGAFHGSLYNCKLNGNSASVGGGANDSTLYNCTLTGNSADEYGGGVDGGILYNCIVYYNTAFEDPNYSGCELYYCCATPLPDGEGNIADEPLLADTTHVSAGSPCIGRGNIADASGTDIDGEPWSTPPAIGCDEYHAGAATGSLNVAISVCYTNVCVGFPIAFTALIEGRATASRWNFGDGMVISNRPYTSRTWAEPGIYSVTLTAWNDSQPQGVSVTVGVAVVAQPTHYVRAGSPVPVAPFTTWESAASNIQDAVEAAAIPGALVLVSNGVYNAGGRTVNGGLTNRVAITMPLIVQSVNGPQVTVIKGVGPNGQNAIRCVYLSARTALIGFTLTNGATRTAGEFMEQYGGGVWCANWNAVVSNCVISGNSANSGGGAYDGTLYNCALTGNSAASGGGADGSTLHNCAIIGNAADSLGGGVYEGKLYNCALAGNSASYAGGANNSRLYNCTLTGNSAASAGGVGGSSLYNCIAYYNTAYENPNYSVCTLNYCCATPLPDGEGNIADEPLLADTTHLSAGSPCIGRGHTADAGGTDIDDEPWSNPPAIGCDEYHAGAATGSLNVAISVCYTNVCVGFPIAFTALIEGRATASRWSFGDDIVIGNRPYISHAWSDPGIYPVTLTVWNESQPQGVSNTVDVAVVAQPAHYVRANSPAPVPPFSTWETAASNIQDAVEAVTVPGALVLVSNGIYNTGGRAVNGGLTNRVAITMPLIVQSVNGPQVTVIEGVGPNGQNAIRCVYLGARAALIGFTLTNGHTRISYNKVDGFGGGIFCDPSAVLSNCVLTGNSATYGGGTYDGTLYRCALTGNSAYCAGGGAWNATLYCCALTGNSAPNADGGGTLNSTLYNCVLSCNSAALGGGASGGILYNCTLADNSARYDGGGSYDGTLYNCIVYYNTAPSGPNWEDATLSYTCTTPEPSPHLGGTNNITSEPQFVDAAAGDYRLLPSSPCIDRGINQDWMAGATDLAGNPRILRGTVDMGAYEFAFHGNFKVWLQGPYDTNTHEMTTALNFAGIIPLTSPYADDPRRVSAIPSNATDWVLLQLQSSTNSTPFVSKSVFLGQEGTLLSDSGAAELMLEASTGSYYVAIKHRNHLAVMSAEPVAFTNQMVSYDFTRNVDHFYGGTNGAVRLESNAWGMIAGDADGDGEILNVDALLYDTQTNSTGYKRADFNLDGVVSHDDHDIFWSNNVGRGTTIVQGETILKPTLKIQPARKTLLAESTNTFFASGETGTITWAFAKNSSGGTIPAIYPTSIVYRAGITSSCIDVLEAWDREDRLGRAYVNIISSNDIASAGKAIIVAGRNSISDSLWPTTDYLGDLAYNTLLYRGYSKANIQYLSPVTNQDVDGNGQMDDIDLPTTLVDAARTFTNWAAPTPQLFVYLVDHGDNDSLGGGRFYLNGTEILTATNLDAWLDNLQNTYTTKVTVLIDCCYAGSFVDELTYTGVAQRIVIAACGTNELTCFLAGGLVSFSDAFFGGVMRGDDVDQARQAASNAISNYQNACWYDHGGGSLATGLYLGASFVAGKDIPQIGKVMGNQLLTRTTAATLWAGDVVSYYPIEQVWCLVAPPGHRPDSENPVTDIPELKLTYEDSSGIYQARYEGFSEKGTYKIIYYAEDVWGSVSAPRQSYVEQSGYDERVILVGGGPTNLAAWNRIDGLARSAYRTFQARWLHNENIYYLSAVTNQDVNGDGTNDVDALISLANLANAITNWAGSTNWGGPADALTVYLIGEGTNQVVRLNETESLDAGSLNGWLSVLLVSNEQAKVNVIMDFSGSGRFLAGLAATNRICVASCRSDQPAIWAADGLVSFSRYFLCRLFEGDNLDQAFYWAKRATRWATGGLSQEAQLDANGDGLYDERDQAESSLARRRYIGAAFVTGADAPTIGRVTPDTLVADTQEIWLWADVTDREDVSNVWCVITPPDYMGIGELVKTNLSWNPSRNRYEALLTNLSQVGSYTLTFQAEDTDGWFSTPVQSFLVVGPDMYESDNTYEEATFFTFGQEQSHNLHVSNDEDWVYFYAVTNYMFQIEAEQTGSNVDLRLDVYYATNLQQEVFRANDSGVGVGKSELVMLDFKAWPNLPSGGYYVRVSSANPSTWGLDSGYTLRVFVSMGANIYFVIVGEGWIGGGLTNATIRLNDNEIVTPDHQGIWHDKRTEDVKVEVLAPSGYRPVTIKGGAANPCWLGSSNLSACYCFAPYVTVTGVIHDAYVGAFVEGAALTFTAQNIHPGYICTSYPNSSNTPQWATTAEGGFPSNVLLPPAQWQLAVEKNGYSTCLVDAINLPVPPPQVTSNLGTLFLRPVDTNGNQIADTWETTYFGADSNVVAGEDRDGDGLCNGAEYVAGTDPTNSKSVLRLVPPVPEPGGAIFNWPIVAGRAYRIQSKTNLLSEGWSNASGIQTAGVNDVSLQWTDTDAVHRLQMFYRLQLIPPVP